MRISVFGLGYVGTVCAACLAELGHEIVGVDISRTKVELLAGGRAPLVEWQLDELVARVVASGALRATTDAGQAIADTQMSLICVGTPSRADGSLDTSALVSVTHEIGRAILAKNAFHAVVVRSTVLPGTVRGTVLPILEETTGGKLGERFGLASNPEFMREGSAVDDFHNPPKTVIGELDAATADALEAIYGGMDAPLFRTKLEVAEFVKYSDNSWHALKVTFANEFGAIAKAAGVDSHAVMDILTVDRKLNISAAYLTPGFAFGGSCLPKDTRALAFLAASLDLEIPVISNLMASNREQIERGVDWIAATGLQKIAFLGISFKAGTDDLRESPFLEVASRLIGAGRDLKIFDKNVQPARLVGANRDYLFKIIPNAGALIVNDCASAIAQADLVVLTVDAPEYRDALSHVSATALVYDFARIPIPEQLGERYHGFLW